VSIPATCVRFIMRYRSSLDEDMEFIDLTAMHELAARMTKATQSAGEAAVAKVGAASAAMGGGGAALAEAAQAAARAADHAVAAVRFPAGFGSGGSAKDGRGGGGKEAVRLLEALKLQANDNVVLPDDQLRIFSQLTGLDTDTIKTLILRLRTNAGSIRVKGAHLGCALSATLSFLNHSCEPNASAQVVAGRLLVSARKPLQQGQELSICYVDATLGRTSRRAVLRDHYGFDCDCARCLAEEGFG